MADNDLEKKVLEHEQQVESGEAKSKKSIWRYVLNISVVLIATALAIFFAVRENAVEIWKNLKSANINYMLVIAGLMAGCIAVRSFILFCFAHLFTRKYHFH